MARIPEFTQRVFLDRANPGNIEAAAAAGGGNAARASLMKADQYQRNARTAQGFSEDLAQDRVRQREEIDRQKKIDAELKAHERFNQIERERIQTFEQEKMKRMANPQGFSKWADEWSMSKLEQVEEENSIAEDPNAFDMTTFRTLMDRERTNYQARTLDWENGMMTQNVVAGTEKSIDEMNVNFSLKNPSLGDLPKHFQTMREFINTTGEKVFSPEQNLKLYSYATDGAAAATMDSMIQNDPRSLNNVLNYGTGGQSSVVNFMMYEIEGGDKVVDEPNGGVAKFGINSVANPDVDVKNLTAEGAAKIYKSRYWDEKLNDYDPAFQVVAFDALVNHGNDKDTWSMINKAKGDPYKLIALRQRKYAELVFSKPEKYAQYQEGWKNRLDKVTQYAQSLDNGGREFLQHASLIDPDVINRTKAVIPEAINAKMREEEAIRKQKLAVFDTRYKDLSSVSVSELEPLTQDELNELKQMATNSGDPEAIAKADALANNNAWISTLKGLSPTQLETTRRQISAMTNKGQDPNGRWKLEAIDKVKANVTKAINEDGLAAYGQMNVIRMPQPLDFSQDPQSGAFTNAIAELQQRQTDAQRLYKDTGRLHSVVLPEEAAMFSKIAETAPADQVAGMLSVFDKLEPETRAAAAAEMTSKSPVLSTAINVDNLEARRRLIAGSRMTELPYKKAENKSLAYRTMANYTDNPAFLDTASDAVSAYYAALSTEKKQGEDGLDEDLMDAAIQDLYGPLVDISLANTDKVFSFKDDQSGQYVQEDDIYNMFNGLTDTTLKTLFDGKPLRDRVGEVTARDILNSGKIRSSGDGLYNVMFDTGYLTNDKGEIVEIDGRKLFSIYKKSGKKAAEKYNSRTDNPWRM